MPACERIFLDDRIGLLCCELSLRAGESLIATATRIDVWILLECREGYGREAFAESSIPEAAKRHLKQQLKAMPNALTLLLGEMFFAYRIEHIRIGRAFTALREDELAASALGINPMHYRVLAFVMGSILAGLAGAISAHLFNTWNPSYGTFNSSILMLAYVLVGGSRTYLGPVIGGLVLTALPEALRAAAGIDGLPTWLAEFLQNSRLIIFGVLIAIGAIFFPEGIITPELIKRRRAPKAPDELPAQPINAPTVPDPQESLSRQ